MNKNSGVIRQHENKLNALHRLIDSLIIATTLWLCSHFYLSTWDIYSTTAIFLSIICYQFFAEASGLYRSSRGISLMKKATKISFIWLSAALTLMLIAYLAHIPVYYNWELYLTWILLTPIELISWHAVIQMFLNYVRSQGGNSRSTAIVGTTQLGMRLEKIFNDHPEMGFNMIGFYDDRVDESDPSRRVNSKTSIYNGSTQQAIEDARSGKIDILYITLPLRAEKRIKELVDKLADTTVSVNFVPDLFTFDLLNSQWSNIHGIPVVSIYDSPFYGVDGLAKRLSDIIIGSAILLLIALPMLLIALGIKLTSKGPVIFKQKRYGLGGHEIIVWKFRSMTVCENGDQVTQARKDDMRITRFGSFLRRTSLDELPQFINVLQGHMSIVGPRPHASSHNEYYRTLIHGYMLRHKVKPGITGLAQISGYRGETDTIDKMEKRIEKDLEYIQNWSLFSDLKIIFLTIFKGFTGKQAY